MSEDIFVFHMSTLMRGREIGSALFHQVLSFRKILLFLCTKDTVCSSAFSCFIEH